MATTSLTTADDPNLPGNIPGIAIGDTTADGQHELVSDGTKRRWRRVKQSSKAKINEITTSKKYDAGSYVARNTAAVTVDLANLSVGDSIEVLDPDQRIKTADSSTHIKFSTGGEIFWVDGTARPIGPFTHDTSQPIIVRKRAAGEYDVILGAAEGTANAPTKAESVDYIGSYATLGAAPTPTGKKDLIDVGGTIYRAKDDLSGWELDSTFVGTFTTATKATTTPTAAQVAAKALYLNTTDNSIWIATSATAGGLTADGRRNL